METSEQPKAITSVVPLVRHLDPQGTPPPSPLALPSHCTAHSGLTALPQSTRHVTEAHMQPAKQAQERAMRSTHV